jgi:hypothetical protein
MAIVNGYTTLADFKLYERITTTDANDDAVIEDIIEAASRYIDQETRRTFYARTETKYYSTPSGRELELDDDLLTVTTLTNGDGSAIAAGNYFLWPRNSAPYSRIVLKQSASVSFGTDANGNSEYVIPVVGTWGFAATAPDNIKQAATLIALSMFKRRFGENLSAVSTITAAGVVVTPQDVPSIAAATIQAYRRRL